MGWGWGWKRLSPSNIPRSGTLAEGPDHSNPESSAPGPCARPDRPPSFLPLHFAGGKAPSQVHPQRCKQVKTKQVFNRKNKLWQDVAFGYHALVPALLPPALLSMPTWYSSHCLTQEKVGTAFREGQPRQCQEQPEALPSGPSGAPAPAAQARPQRESCTLLRLCIPQRTTLPGPPLQEASPPPPEVSGRVRLLQGLLSCPQVT